MLPALCVALFGLGLLLLLLVLIPILGAAFSDDVKKAMEDEAQKNAEEPTLSVAAALCATWIFIAICAGLFMFDSECFLIDGVFLYANCVLLIVFLFHSD